MAMVLDAFVSHFAERLTELVASEITMLLGVKDDLRTLQITLERLERLLADAESKRTSSSIGLWLARLRDVMYDADDLLDDYRAASEAEAALRSRRRYRRFLRRLLGIPFRHEVGTRIKAINQRLSDIENETGSLNLVAHCSDRNIRVLRPADTSPVIVEEDIVGIDGDARDLVALLTASCGLKCGTYAITGMPGIGKTTLAQKVYNDPEVKCHYQLKLWICVSKQYNDVDLLKQIARSMTLDDEKKDKGEIYGDANTRAELDQIVSRLVNGRRYLLVLDDVWDAGVWEMLRKPLKSGANESRVLITTRNREVANAIPAAHIHYARHLSDKECWVMLCKVVFGDDIDKHETKNLIRKLEDTGMEIAKKCKGLPLSVKTIGGLLKTRGNNEHAWDQVRLSPTWQLENLPDGIMPGLLLSYEDLPSYLKQCLIYCSLFPEDFKFHQHYLVQMWIAEGFIKGDEMMLEESGEQYYKELVMRNLLQAMPDYYNGKGCTMHDLVRLLARHASQNEFKSGDPHRMQSSCTKPRHLSIFSNESSMITDMKEHECLRTLLLSKNPMIKEIPKSLFNQLRRLRVLDLTYTGIVSLPDSLGDLIHLRFLNVAFTKLVVLPETIQNLKNLQTLKANGLKKLRKLPIGIVQLLNLRHLTVGSTFTQLKEMPVGISGFKKLRTLDGFVANRDKSNMGDLNFLSNLTYMSMYKLERISGRTEAEGANLVDKLKLNFLRLACSRKPKMLQYGEGDIKRIEGVFEGLSPPLSTDGIVVESFFGRHFPYWIRECSLTKLTWLRLDDCRYVTQLPPLGRLPELRVVHIWNLSMVSEIGHEFFCGLNGFPKLSELYLLGMTSMEKISGLGKGSLSRLKKLHVIRCPKLASLPEGLQYATNLTKMAIEGGENIKGIENLCKIEELKLSGNPKLQSISNLPSLSRLNVNECPFLKQVNGVDELSHVFLSDLELQILPDWLIGITSLKRLDVRGSADLVARCHKTNGEDWPKIKHASRIEARSLNGSSYVSYSSDPQSFQSNLTNDNIHDSSPSRVPSITEITEGGYSSRSFASVDA